MKIRSTLLLAVLVTTTGCGLIEQLENKKEENKNEETPKPNPHAINAEGPEPLDKQLGLDKIGENTLSLLEIADELRNIRNLYSKPKGTYSVQCDLKDISIVDPVQNVLVLQEDLWAQHELFLPHSDQFQRFEKPEPLYALTYKTVITTAKIPGAPEMPEISMGHETSFGGNQDYIYVALTARLPNGLKKVVHIYDRKNYTIKNRDISIGTKTFEEERNCTETNTACKTADRSFQLNLKTSDATVKSESFDLDPKRGTPGDTYFKATYKVGETITGEYEAFIGIEAALLENPVSSAKTSFIIERQADDFGNFCLKQK